MERNTLSHYGWIIVMVLTLSVVLAFATPFGKYVGRGVVSMVQAFRNANDANFNEDHRAELEDRWEQKLVDPDLPPIYDLQQQYKFEYYSKFSLAMSDINNDAIGANADVDKKDAVAGIYTDNNGVVNVVLLKDATETERTSIKKFVILNLGGKTLTYNNAKVGIDVYNGITILGQYKGSGITANGLEYARPVQVRSGILTINGGIYTNNIQQYPETPNGADAVIYSISQENYISNATINANGGMNTTFQFGGNSTIENCKAKVETENSMGIGIFAGGTLNMNNSSIDLIDKGTKTEAISNVINPENETVTLNISNCKIIGKSDKEIDILRGINNKGMLNIKDSDILVAAKGKNIVGIQTNENSTASISNCNIKAYANYIRDSGGDTHYDSISVGIINIGALRINDSYVVGTHSGISDHNGDMEINGGTYESFGHGGIYFAGVEKSAYVRNAIIRDCEMPDGYINNKEGNGSALYIGGATGNDNVSVYMDNCQLSGKWRTAVLRGTDGEKNNSLYMSNCTNNGTPIRVDNETHKLYIGTGCNFTINDVINGKGQAKPEFATETNETYVKTN